MITIISGVPGAGKTALIVDMMMEELKRGRKIFTYGIPQLLLPVHEAGDVHEWQDGTWLQIDRYDPELTKRKGIKSTWFPRGCSESCEYLSTCPRNHAKPPDSGALIVIDESHTEFPQRPSGKQPPPHIEALTVHRHQGLDFWFLSQKPSFLDSFIRGLSSRHIHLALNAFSFTGKRIKYEWAEYQETVNRTSKLMASKSDYKPSPAVFPLYASATVHTKLDQRMPTIMKAFILCVVILLIMVGLAVSRVHARVQDINQLEAKGKVHKSLPPAEAKQAGGGGERSAQAPPASVAQAVFKPDVPDTQLISACVASEARCQCYTHHGIKLQLSEAECRAAALAPTDKFRL